MIIYNKNGPKILMYHSIANDSKDRYSVAIDMFEKQIVYLVKNKYDIISLEKLVYGLKNGNCMKNKIVITFDDGYKNFITNAFPILKKHNLLATVFVVFDLLGEKAIWNDNGLQLDIMNKEDLHYIKKHGISLGGHTLMHTDLTSLNLYQLRKHLATSKKKLESYGEKFMSFSYPWGRYSKREMDVLKDEGFECALIANVKYIYLQNCLYQLGRLTMQRDMTIDLFKKEIEGRSLIDFTLNKIKGYSKAPI